MQDFSENHFPKSWHFLSSVPKREKARRSYTIKEGSKRYTIEILYSIIAY